MMTEDIFTFYLIPKIKTEKSQYFTILFDSSEVMVTIYVDGERKI